MMKKLKLITVLIMMITYASAGDPSSRIIKIAGVQMSVTHNIAENEQRILNAIEKAAANKIDFLITPEGSLSGYWAGFDCETLNRSLERVVAAARKARVGLVLGTCYMEDCREDLCYNQVRVYSPEGEFLGTYAKILRCSHPDLPGSGEMNQYLEGRLRTFEWKGIQFGTLICNDFWATPGHTTIPNPCLPWKLKQLGAQIIFHSINSGTNQQYKPFHESSVALWAIALRIPVVEVNAAAEIEGERINASSGVVSPEGERMNNVDTAGEQFFIYELKVPEREELLGEEPR